MIGSLGIVIVIVDTGLGREQAETIVVVDAGTEQPVMTEELVVVQEDE